MKLRLLLFLTMLSLVGCQLDELRDDFRPSSHKAFSIEDAKEFFEKDYVDRLTKSQGEDSRSIRFRGRLYSGDFMPLWDKAVYSESDGVAAYDVEIQADRSIFAIKSKFGPSGARAQKLKVYQKLVVRLNVESRKMAAYVMSIIPDVGCDDRCIPERFRSRGKDKGGFSGIVVYATTERGAIVRVQEYKGGVKKRGVYIPSGKGSYIDRCVKAREILNGVTLMSKRNIQTRSGEDDWSDFYGGELDESICIGEKGEGGQGTDDDWIQPGEVSPEDDDDEEAEPWPDPEDEIGDLVEELPPDTSDFDDDYDCDLRLEEQMLKSKSDALVRSLGDAIGSVKVGLTIEIGTPANSQFSEIVSLTTSDLFEKNQNYIIRIVSDLDDTQQKLVLAHEFMHLKLFEISQGAGSASELGRSNPELYGIINLYHADKDNNLYWLNDAHHFYMGQHVEEMEQLLRDAFPGMEEEFYEYGKWGGGAHASDAFRGLSFDEKTIIATYLVSIGLLNE